MELSNSVNLSHVDEAIRLFQESTMSAVAQGHVVEGMGRPAFYDCMNETIQMIKAMMPIGSSKKFSELLGQVNASNEMVEKAVNYLARQNKLLVKEGGRVIVRLP